MKVKNIVFSGVMGAILMGATGAHAAISVASQGYVDAKVAKDVAALGTTVSTTYQTKADAETAAQGVTQALAGKADKGTTLEAYGITDAYTTTEADEKFMIMKDATALGTNLQWTTDGKLDTKGIATTDGLNALTNTVDNLSGVVNGNAETEGTVANKIATAVKALEDGQVKDNKDAIAALNDTYVSEDEMDAFKEANTAKINAKVDLAVYDQHLTAQDAIDDKQTGDIAANAQAIAGLDNTYVKDSDLATTVSDLETDIADAKQAGTDANAALEAYKTTNNAAVEAAKSQADKGVADAATAQAAANKAQGEVDTLEGTVSTLETELATKITAPAACETQDCVLSINKASGTITWVPLTEPTADFLN